MRILMLEDHADTAQAYGMLLRDRGHDVTIAMTVDEARLAVHRGHFDLIMCDVELPDGDGCDFMRELRSQLVTSRGIAMSGHCYPADVKRCLDAGFDRHLMKPIDIDTLVREVESLDVPQEKDRGARVN